MTKIDKSKADDLHDVTEAMLSSAKAGSASAAKVFLQLRGQSGKGAPLSTAKARADESAVSRWYPDETAHERAWRRLLRPAQVYLRDPEMIETETGEAILPDAEQLAQHSLAHGWAETIEEAREAARQVIETYEARGREP